MAHQIPCPKEPESLTEMLASTPARLGIWRAGSRPLTNTWLTFRQDHAIARDAVLSELTEKFLDTFVAERQLPVIQTLASDRQDFVLSPPKGKKASPETINLLRQRCPANCDVQIVISDGLSAQAVEANIPDLLPMLE